MSTIKIAVIPGDGIGKEVMPEGIRALEAAGSKHGIEFEMLVAGSSDKARAAETLPMLNHVLAFPTLIFIDREGEVREIHTGFAGSGTGEHYLAFKSRFTSLVDDLLAEKTTDGP